MEIGGPISSQLKALAENRYVIGPVAESSFWDGEQKDFDGIRGPCKENCFLWMTLLIATTGPTPQDYIKAVADREIAWLTNYASSVQIRELFQAAT